MQPAAQFVAPPADLQAELRAVETEIARLRVQEGCSFSAAATPPSLRRDGMAAHFRFAEARRFVFCLK